MNEAMNITPAELARAFVQQLQKLVPLWEKKGFASIHDDYIAACIASGAEIRLRLPDGELSGVFCGVSDSGALIIETGGHKQELQAGEIMELRS
jgi:biotin-(acetyl-CoA carboxylase) ligase